MLRFLLCYLRPTSQTEPRSVEEIRDDLQGSLVKRRELAEKIVKEGEIRAELASDLGNLMEEFERRVKVARSGPGLADNTEAEICQKCWSGEEYPWYGPSPADVFVDFRRSHHRLIINCESLDVVHQRVSSLQDEFAEAVRRENLDLHFGREQLDIEVFLPPEMLETIDQVQYGGISASLLSNVIDWDAKIHAAHQKFRACSIRVHQAVNQFDQLLIEPMREKHRNCVSPPQIPCVAPDERTKARYRMYLQLHVASKQVASGLLLTEESQEVIDAVEYVTASISVTAPEEITATSAAATVDHIAAIVLPVKAARLDVAIEVESLKEMTSV